jgi:hypothetical protein
LAQLGQPLPGNTKQGVQGILSDIDERMLSACILLRIGACKVSWISQRRAGA